MSQFLRKSLTTSCLFGLLTVPLAGCCCLPSCLPCCNPCQMTLRQSQYRGNQLWTQNRSMAQESEQYKRMLGQMQQQNDQLKGNLDLANKRLDNLNNERAQLNEKYRNALTSGGHNPLSPEANARFQDLEKSFPGFKFNPETGVSQLDSDLLFESGSDEIRPQAENAIREVAKILNDGTARQLRVQVVGHTDDRPIVKVNTKQHHPTNWHLSTNRANSVLLALKKHGIDERRMRSAGAGMYESVADNKDPKARSKNRRVEIYVLAPDAKDVAAIQDQPNE